MIERKDCFQRDRIAYNASHSLLTAHCSLFTAHRSLLTAHCSLLIFLLSLTAVPYVHAKAQAEEPEIKKQNNEWILCVTNFDISSVSETKLVVANVITKKVVERLNEINYRTRISPEYAYYEGQAWAIARTSAAKALSAKQEERSLMLYRGDESWRYKQNLDRVNADIEKLRIAFDEIDGNPPVINNEPLFSLTSGNKNFTFPDPPAEGSESKFARDQKADAFLTGKIMDFHGRFIISINLYTVFTRSYVYEDSIIFSNDDLEEALDEITRRLMMTLSGNRHAAIAVSAEPKDTLVLINRSFAGRGDTGVLEQSPGKYTIIASAADHESLTMDLELLPGELADISIFLKAHEYSNVEISGDVPGGTIYHGALYVGEAPLTLRLPADAIEYIELETRKNLRGTAVFHTPSNPDATSSLSVRTSVPPVKGRVEKVRNQYYWGWGATWLTGIAAWIAYQSYVGSNNAIRDYYLLTESVNENFYNENRTIYSISVGAIAAVSAVAVYHYVQLGRYLYYSNKGSTPIVKTQAGNK